MSSIRRIALPGATDTTPTNPLDLWGRRVAIAIAVLVGLPTLIAGMVALIS
ncbi:hypothetical protein [Leifsonia shinshuensis]|uniref:hypothetical protein n=1 Tax=Leifsonia TaxID=110932 RepID=UPI002856B542|nr:hypothetical protein [Leifsonia shinshuensis]MDR6972008.1 hypothetical protein [Leifsonia shinshuensis]